MSSNMKISIKHPPLWLVNIATFGVMLALSFSLVNIYAIDRMSAIKSARAEAERALPAINDLAENPFANLALVANAAAVFDISRKKVIYGYHESEQLPLASLTKLMTAVVAAETLPSYTNIEIIATADERDVRLRMGERWPLAELLSYTLMTSSNAGADSVAAAAASYLSGKGTQNTTDSSQSFSPFVDGMNKKAHELGLNQTYFLNPSGLDTTASISGAYGSAQDVALLVAHVVEHYPDLLASTEQSEQTFNAPDGRKISVKNTNEHVSEIPGLIGSKTGLTDLAGGNLAVVFDASFSEPFVIVVLNSTENGRFDDVARLVKATIDYLGAGMKAPHSASDAVLTLPATIDKVSYNTNQ